MEMVSSEVRVEAGRVECWVKRVDLREERGRGERRLS